MTGHFLSQSTRKQLNSFRSLRQRDAAISVITVAVMKLPRSPWRFLSRRWLQWNRVAYDPRTLIRWGKHTGACVQNITWSGVLRFCRHSKIFVQDFCEIWSLQSFCAWYYNTTFGLQVLLLVWPRRRSHEARPYLDEQNCKLEQQRSIPTRTVSILRGPRHSLGQRSHKRAHQLLTLRVKTVSLFSMEIAEAPELFREAPSTTSN